LPSEKELSARPRVSSDRLIFFASSKRSPVEPVGSKHALKITKITGEVKMLSGHMIMVAEVVIFIFNLESCCNCKPFVFTNIPNHNILIIVK